jgi:peptide/nickel transport system ATP-binding protein
MTGRPLLEVSGLRVQLANGTPIVDGVDFSLEGGKILGLVGESGSGKTTVALALLGFAKPGVRVADGTVRVGDEQLVGRPERELRRMRGVLVSYVPQDPASSLNPSLRVGEQLAEVLRVHSLPHDDARIEAALGRVQLPGSREFMRRFPHQLSGGQQQRVSIASALVCGPSLVVMDEPTTGLDVVTQAGVLEEVQRLRRELGLAIVYVSHNLAVIGELADEVAVMYAGRLVETGPTSAVLGRPRHPYTRGLVSSIPDFLEPQQLRGIAGVGVRIGEWPRGCSFAPRCEQRVPACEERLPELEPVASGSNVRCIEWRRTPRVSHYPAAMATHRSDSSPPVLEVESLRAVYRSRSGTVTAARDVSFSIGVGETVGLVGESGSGKTTIGRCIIGLHEPAAGKIRLNGVELAAQAGKRPRDARRLIQIVFQNPQDSLNPRHRILDEIARPAQILRGASRRAAEAEALSLLGQVQLPTSVAQRFPPELSGGERQRIAIARALAAGPSLLICDEITSALDVSVQATVLEVLVNLQTKLGLSMLFISHDLGVVASVASRALVLESGEVREEGELERVLRDPHDEYTRRLINAAPRLRTGIWNRDAGDNPSSERLPTSIGEP